MFFAQFATLCQFCNGDMITTLELCRLSPLGGALHLYGTLNGNIGYFIPFRDNHVYYLFKLLNSFLTNECNVVSMDHNCGDMASISANTNFEFHSRYLVNKCCIDGDFSDSFWYVERTTKQQEFAKSIDKKLAIIKRQICGMHTSVL